MKGALGEGSSYISEDEAIMAIVKKAVERNTGARGLRSIFEETKGMIGSAKIRIIMKNRGYVIDLEHLRRLMKEMNLVCTTRQKVAHNTEPPKQKYYINRLKQQFTVYEPNKVWVCDTTYLYVNYEAYYL